MILIIWSQIDFLSRKRRVQGTWRQWSDIWSRNLIWRVFAFATNNEFNIHLSTMFATQVQLQYFRNERLPCLWSVERFEWRSGLSSKRATSCSPESKRRIPVAYPNKSNTQQSHRLTWIDPHPRIDASHSPIPWLSAAVMARRNFEICKWTLDLVAAVFSQKKMRCCCSL